MIIYQGTSRSFQQDVYNENIAKKLEELFISHGLHKETHSEFVAWQNSLQRMANAISGSKVPQDAQVAVEFQIPLTSKRVDFMIGGSDGVNDNIVVVELKQWQKCKATDKENVVIARVGGMEQDLAHPSQQAYGYSQFIQSFNEDIQIQNIKLYPCAYLHNYDEKYRDQICAPQYQEAIDSAPVFLGNDSTKLRGFIENFIKKPSNKKLFEIVDEGKIKPSKALQDSVGSILDGNEEYVLIDEQLVAYSTILKKLNEANVNDRKTVIIVQGGPGTGKSVIAVNLLAKIIASGYSCQYVSKNSAPRGAFKNNLFKGKYNLSYLKNLFQGSGAYYLASSNAFDCLIVDEAHRLVKKSGYHGDKGENQIKEIINASRMSVFFIDEDQKISVKDIGTISEIEKWANYYDAEICKGPSLVLKSQFRCNGSDGYLAFLDDVLEIRQTANAEYFDVDYDIRVFDDVCEMREALRKTNVNNKSRMIAGYCYEWVSQNDKTKYDIFLPGGFKAQWNFKTAEFATDPESFEQVGCIHSTQGLEFDYVGIIIGQDLRYENGYVITDRTKRDRRDVTVKGLHQGDSEADEIIRNTYKVLLSRGQKGCFVYCEDRALAEYLKKRLKAARDSMKGIEGSVEEIYYDK